MADKFDSARERDPTALAGNVLAGALNTDLPAGTKGIFFDADAVVSVTNRIGGAAVTGVPVIKGVVLPFIPKQVNSLGVATAFWYVFD